MVLPKWKLVIYLSGLLLSLAMLAACNQTNKVTGEVSSDSDTPAIFGADDLNNALQVTVSEIIDLPSVDLNNEEVNIEGEVAPEDDDSGLSNQAVLPGAFGWLVYYRVNASGTYQIYTANQTNDAKTNVFSSTRAIQSVAVSGDGNWVAASIITPSSGKYDIYLFDVANSNTYQLTSTSKDELDVSMTADGSKIVYSQQTNAGLWKIRVCDYNFIANSCSISILGATQNQRQASITGNGDYVVLIRDINPGKPNARWRVLLYDMDANTYTIVVTRPEELSHPSADHDGTLVMFLQNRTSITGNYLVRIKNLMTNSLSTELTKPELDHPHMTPRADFFTYKDLANNGWYRAFTRNITTNARASAHGGDWNYYAPYWQQLSGEVFLATLTGSQEVPPVSTNATGKVEVTLDEGNKTIELTGEVKDLSSEITAAHIHQAPAGNNGGVIFPLTIDTSNDATKKSAELSGSFVVNDSQIAELKANGLYVNVHSLNNPGGEVRGQLISASNAITFKVTIENISTTSTLILPDTSTIAVPLSPGVWVVHASGDKPLFTSNAKDRGEGLEALAEDGSPNTLGSSIAGKFKSSGIFNTPVGAGAPGAIGPGGKYEFEVMAAPGDRLSIATMFVQSNDLFYAYATNGVDLFNADNTPKNGNLAGISLWDAGTEADQTPGIGSNQAPRQLAPNTGPVDPNDKVRRVTGTPEAPNTNGGVIMVSVSPN